MEKILDTIVGNKVLFIGLLFVLVLIFLILVFSIVKSFRKQKKIHIYEEDLDKKELDHVKEKNVIDTPEHEEEKKKEEDSSIKEEPSKVEEEKEEHHEEETTPTLEEPKEETEPEEPVVELEISPERVAELESLDEKEIEKRIDKEHEEAIQEAIQENHSDVLKEALTELKENKEISPEEVVRQFEQEQEAQSIISYQELVDVVKNRDTDYEDELESKPLATVSDVLPEEPVEKEDRNQTVVDLIEKLEQPKVEPPKEEKIEKVESIPELPVEPAEENVQVVESIPELPTSGIPEIVEESPTPVEKIETIDVLAKEKEESEREAARQAVREALHNIPDDGRFKKTEVISPVFGRMETKEAEYPTVKKFNHEENTSSIQNIEELPSLPKSDMIKPEATEKVASLDELIENDKEKEVSKTTDLSKNEDLLKALKDFRDSL